MAPWEDTGCSEQWASWQAGREAGARTGVMHSNHTHKSQAVKHSAEETSENLEEMAQKPRTARSSPEPASFKKRRKRSLPGEGETALVGN